MRQRALLLALAAAAACGGRSDLTSGPPKPPEPECAVDADCLKDGDLCNPSVCQLVPFAGGAGGSGGADGGDGTILVAQCVKAPPVDCDDHDPCTTDTCERTTGLCAYSPATLDLDGDGHRAPRPGFLPGESGACGDDCDDTTAAAFPGNPETCDGVDNDCNGVVDDNATFTPLGGGDVRISGLTPAGPGGLAFSGSSYAAVYTGSDGGTNVYVSTITPDGTVINPPGEQLVTLVNADASSGPVVWVGDRYGVAWQDRRSGDYEVYFTILDATGAKKHADTQLTFADGFSVNVALAWNNSEFLVVWQDDRDGAHNIYGQRVSVDSVPIGGNVQFTNNIANDGNESPSIATGLKTVAIASNFGDSMGERIQLQTFSLDLTQPASPPVDLTDGSTDAINPRVVWNKDRYVVVWFDKKAFPQAIYAATVSEDGTILTPAKAVTSPGPFHSRFPSVRALGDRLLLVYSDDRDQNAGYEIYSRMLSPTLDPLTPEFRVTHAPNDSVDPIAAFGPNGNVGILFRDDRENWDQNIYFTRLGCVSGGP
ncbi:MAG: putative metal-binding motif-containing protein [Minicystis sp.]